MKPKPQERAEARRLRRKGLPLKRIAARLDVSIGSVHRWTKDIRLTPEQLQQNLTGPRGPQSPEQIAKRVSTWRHKNRERRLAAQKEGRARARHRDPLHLAGCMLYWAEGAKDRNAVKFCNSDPQMVRLFTVFVRESLGVAADRLRVRLNLYTNNGLSVRQVEDFWLRLLQLPRSSLRKHQLNHYPTSTSGAKRNRLPHGVCSLTVAASTREVQHIYGAIQEYAGFEEPRWLDGPPRKVKPGRGRAKPARPATPAAPSGRGGGSRPGPRPRSGRRKGRPR